MFRWQIGGGEKYGTLNKHLFFLKQGLEVADTGFIPNNDPG